jgi:hypothetical protein
MTNGEVYNLGISFGCVFEGLNCLVTFCVETALRNNSLEGKVERRTVVTVRRRRRGKQRLDDLKERIGYGKLKEEALDGTLWRTRFGRG